MEEAKILNEIAELYENNTSICISFLLYKLQFCAE